jgi:NAD(P)-dependent dehydrogenase (short-subunit alcohol dehydrogenase family)
MAIALITGANKGLGLGCAQALSDRGYTVIMTARDLKKLKPEADKLKSKNSKVSAIQLDTSDYRAIEEAVNKITFDHKTIDILINNAGIFLDGLKDDGKVFFETLTNSFQTNTIGPALLIKKILPIMKKNNFGRIVNVSSGMAGLTEMEGGSLAYRTSKAALNVVTRVFAREASGSDILVNSVCPGWVKTDMGGAGASRTIPEGVASILWAADLPAGGPNGGFFRDGKPLAW